VEDFWGQALTLNTLARFAERREDLGLAKVRYHQSQRLAELIAPDLFTVVDTMIGRARVTCLLGDQEEADELVEEALQLARQAGNSLLIARALSRRGRQVGARGDFAAARRDLLESLSLLQARSRTEEAALCAIALGDTEKASGDRASAIGWYQEAVSLDAGCAEAAERLGSMAEGNA
jgi:tetratricopeptide (TPR) repeat protein